MTSNTASSYIEQDEAASIIALGKAGAEAVSQEHPPYPAAPWSYGVPHSERYRYPRH